MKNKYPFINSQINYMREDIENDMIYSKMEMIVRKRFKEQGKDFDKEFEKFHNKIIIKIGE